ncbi:MAG TPA: MFS transporter [Burkholderiales bacterium]|nr:MFS transporter [Burkholderiales bacterium]
MHVLRRRDFALFLGGRFASVLAAQMQWVGIGWYLYDLTGSAMTLAFAGLAAFVPIALLTLPAGDLADRVDRRWLLAAAHLFQAGAAALLFFLVLIRFASPWAFYAALVLSGTTRALSGPAAKSIVPLLVPREQFAQSVAWTTSTQQIAVIAGPALGGLVYLLGGPVTFAACFFLALGAVVAMIAIRTEVLSKKEAGTTALARAMAGLRFVASQPILLGAISLDLFAVLIGGVNALLPVFARDILQVGPGGLGLLRSTFAVGAIVTSLALAQLPEARQPHAGRALFGGVALFGAGALLFAWSTHLSLSMAALAVMGAGDSLSVFVRATVVQLASPEAMRGRVSAIHVLFVGCTNELGEFRAGLLASWLGAVPAALAGGVGTLLIVALWGQLFPALRRVDRLSEVAPESASRVGNIAFPESREISSNQRTGRRS